MRREPDLALAGTFPGSMLSMYNVDSASDGAPTGSVYIVLEEHGGKHTAGVVLDEDAVADLLKALKSEAYRDLYRRVVEAEAQLEGLREKQKETDRQRRVAEAKAEMLEADRERLKAQLAELDTDPTLEPEIEAVAQMAPGYILCGVPSGHRRCHLPRGHKGGHYGDGEAWTGFPSV